MNVALLALVMALLPFASFLALFFAPRDKKISGPFATLLITVSCACAIGIGVLQWGQKPYIASIPWFAINSNLRLQATLYIDTITILMCVVVTFVSLLVHVFSLQYMKQDPRFTTYFSYLGLFTFAKLAIVLSGNLLLMFMAWELVGLASYLLIGFWHQKDSATNAAIKAFVVNRIGDAGFLVAIFIVWTLFGTLELQELQVGVTEASLLWEDRHTILTFAGIGFLLACMGKSAQFPLQIWLPDAMEGPTPVSALIHAATMVAAGIYLLCRVFFLLNEDVLHLITLIGALTAVLGAFSALFQNDIKKVLAYSTISQLGLMVLAVGIGSYTLALFHLFTHAFFKACLFLCAGAIIHAMHHLEHELQASGRFVHFDVQDMTVMGGLRKAMPYTFICYTIAMLSLVGLPFFSGYLSKDAILLAVWTWSEAGGLGTYLIPVMAFGTVLLTAFYMGRQWFLLFMGSFRMERFLATRYLNSITASGTKGLVETMVHEAPLLMRVPLALLAFFSFFWIFSFNPFDAQAGWLLTSIRQPEASSFAAGHVYVGLFSVLLAAAGLALAWRSHIKRNTFPLSKPLKIAKELSVKSLYLDRLYHVFFVNLALVLAALSNRIDSLVIDRLINKAGKWNVLLANIIAWFDKYIVDGIVNLLAYLAGKLGQLSRSIQGGTIHYYLFWALAGMLGLLLWIIKR